MTRISFPSSPAGAPDSAALARYLTGESDSAERARIEAWMAAAPEHEQWMSQIRAVWFAPEAEAASWDTEALWARVMAPASSRPSQVASVSDPHASRSRTAARWMAFPLLLVGILTLGVILRSHASSRHSAPARTYATNTGQRATVTLRDGSRIILAPHTQLSIARDFGQHERIVTLTGEAYFDVMAAARTPFIVRSGPVTTRVLGTTFDVRHYPADPEVRVAVVTGKVMAQGARAPVLLAAGTVGHLTDSSNTTTAVSDARTYTEWTNGELVFTDTPVPALLATLRHWYGYDFQLTDATLNAQHVTTVLPAANSAELFVILRDLLGVSVTVDHQTVTLRPRRPSRDVPQTARPIANPHPVLEVGR